MPLNWNVSPRSKVTNCTMNRAAEKDGKLLCLDASCHHPSPDHIENHLFGLTLEQLPGLHLAKCKGMPQASSTEPHSPRCSCQLAASPHLSARAAGQGKGQEGGPAPGTGWPDMTACTASEQAGPQLYCMTWGCLSQSPTESCFTQSLSLASAPPIRIRLCQLFSN